MEKNATVKLVLDTRQKERFKNIRIRITFKRQPRLFSTLCNITLSNEEFKNNNLKKTKTVLDETKNALDIAKGICDELGEAFTFSKFSKLYREIF